MSWQIIAIETPFRRIVPVAAQVEEPLENGPKPLSEPRPVSGALLMGADYRALGVARSLGRKGIPVWVVKQGGHRVATVSRYVSNIAGWPEASEPARVAWLAGLSAQHRLKSWLLVPTDDSSVALAARHHQLLTQHYKLAVPPWNDVEWACDKRLLHQRALRHGVPTPWTACPLNREELATLDCPFPVIVKPAVRAQPSSLGIPKAWLAENRQSLLAQYDQATHLVPAENLMVQEVVPGGGEAQFSYAALCRQGCPLASIVARRTRQFPSDFGQFSTFVETVDEPDVMEPAERLIAAAKFTGLVEVEFKKDPRDGQFKVLDINPRIWGWHTLSRAAGVDFPFLLWLLANGEPIPEVRGCAGKRWMHMSADLRVAAEDILRGRLSVGSYVRSLRGPVESAIFAWDDPLPGLLDLPLFAWDAGRHKFRL